MKNVESGPRHLIKSIKNNIKEIIQEKDKEIKKNNIFAGVGVAGIIGGLALIIGDGTYLNPISAYFGIAAVLAGTVSLRNSTESISELKAKKAKK